MIRCSRLLPALAMLLLLCSQALAQTDAAQYDDRQLALMEARILSRQGRLPESLALYEKLRVQYPGDDEVWLDYVETLSTNDLHEQAIIELARFRKKFGPNPRAERLETSLYSELQQPQRAQELLEKTMRGNPTDPGLWSQLAFMRQANNDALGAIQTFNTVLEIDPDNQAAKDALRSLLLENKPKLDLQYTYLDQGKNIATQTQSAATSVYLTDRTRLFLHYDQVNIFRPDVDPSRVSQDLSMLELRADYRVTPQWYLEYGAKTFSGLGDGVSPMLGTRYDYGKFGKVRIAYSYHEPYYDVADAAELHASKDHFITEYELSFLERWRLYSNYEHEVYYLTQHESYYRWSSTSSLSYKLWSAPETYLTYTFNAENSDYRNGYSPAYDLIRRELGHAGSVTITQPITRWLDITVSGGIQHDYERKVEALNASGKLILKPMDRLNLELGYDYTSQSASNAAGGENQIYTCRLSWLF